ncbi:hypothetical protein FHX42_002418 [Saccharopolyspora lacisalsi]|uniref:Uncharacterized protein n=1 Tax=Halosaccharopolyspora lacisalsi TaxID=1000566 RepID=A0A839DZZ8_9PSEU|nr:hypothetical protein [Halosaccharopolyspora lacisalsi]
MGQLPTTTPCRSAHGPSPRIPPGYAAHSAQEPIRDARRNGPAQNVPADQVRPHCTAQSTRAVQHDPPSSYSVQEVRESVSVLSCRIATRRWPGPGAGPSRAVPGARRTLGCGGLTGVSGGLVLRRPAIRGGRGVRGLGRAGEVAGGVEVGISAAAAVIAGDGVGDDLPGRQHRQRLHPDRAVPGSVPTRVVRFPRTTTPATAPGGTRPWPTGCGRCPAARAGPVRGATRGCAPPRPGHPHPTRHVITTLPHPNTGHLDGVAPSSGDSRNQRDTAVPHLPPTRNPSHSTPDATNAHPDNARTDTL